MKKYIFRLLLLIIVAFLGGNSLQAAYLKDVPRTLLQPNGDTLHCFASGDEFYHYLHDANQYTIIQNIETGFFVYADRSEGHLVPTPFIPGTVDPASVGLKPGLRISAELWSSKRDHFLSQVPAKPLRASFSVTEQNHGHINNLVVFIRFSGDPNLTTGFSTVQNMFNDSSASAVSMYNYFKSTSYNQLFITSSFYPAPSGNTILSYQDIYERSYYLPYSSTNTNGYDGDTQRRNREHGLLQRAINFIASSVPSSLNIDYDSDGYVDNVCFVVKGQVSDWSDLLWPHRWSLYSQNVYINSKRVYDYNFMLEGSSTYFSTHVLCHEMQHTLSFPDFYHYDDNTINPMGSWDLMCSTTNPPQNSVAYAKYKYGNWISTIPVLTTPGTYTLNPLATSPTGNAYKIPSELPGQFFVLEYRSDASQFDSAIPGSGIIIYRVNENFNGNANYNGTTVFDEIYVFRPNGTHTTNGSHATAFFNATVGRTAFNATTNPRPFFSNGTFSSLSISNITTAGSTISFDFDGFTPSISSNSNELTFNGNITTGAPTQNITINGLNLVDSITVIVTAPFQVSKNNLTWFSTLKLAPNGGTLYVKYNALTVGSHSGTITLSSGTAQPVTVNLYGTICDVISTFPFTEGFENGSLPSCWAQTFETGQVNWIFQNGGHNGGSSTNHPTFAHSGTKNGLFFHDSYSQNKTKLITPSLNVTLISNPQLTFWRAHPAWGGDVDELKVFYRTGPTANWVLLNTYSTSTESWTLTTINLPNPSSTYYIAFEAKSNYGYGVSIDDISVHATVLNSEIITSIDTIDFQTVVGQPSIAQFFTFSGVDLLDSITVTAPTHFEISKNNTSWYNQLKFPYNSSEAVFVRFNPTTDGTFSSSLTLQSGTTQKNVILNGIASPQMFTILAMSNAGGTIEPAGNIEVVEGADQTFIMTPNPGFVLSSLFIDDEVVPTQTQYLFSNVSNGHIIYAYFVDPTKVDDVSDSFNVILYPNPVYNHLNINMMDQNIPNVDLIRLYDPSGKLIYSLQPVNKNCTIDMSLLSQGIYILKFYTDKGLVAKKIVKL
ncbi:MAG: M6 family metalloprotease domain-containing protein [Bacteroidales bacterium]|jgi:M6 family metalloprotease-like protein|nr:M6 family metalloprotease domain-containing protein [Bacteroidales bacterium]